MEMVLSDPWIAILDNVTGLAKKWLELIEKKRDEEKYYCASIIYTAGLLVVSIRALYNSWYNIMMELFLFNSDWSKDDRDDIAKRITKFAGQERILPHIRQYHETLKTLVPDPEEDHKEDQADKQNPMFSLIRRIKEIFAQKRFELTDEERGYLTTLRDCGKEIRSNVRDADSPYSFLGWEKSS